MTLLSKLKNRLEVLLVKALVKSVGDDSDVQLVKVTGFNGETYDGVEHIQNYGLTSNPPIDSEAVVVFINGNRDQGVVVACDSAENRPKTNSGEVAIYSKYSQIILLDEDGNIKISLPGTCGVGNESDFVALSTKVKAPWDALIAALNTFVAPGTPDGGTALAALLKATMQASATDFASTNLKAD